MNEQMVLAFAALAMTSAATEQAYGVVSAGISKYDVDCVGAYRGTAIKLLGGYKFNPSLAVEKRAT